MVPPQPNTNTNSNTGRGKATASSHSKEYPSQPSTPVMATFGAETRTQALENTARARSKEIRKVKADLLSGNNSTGRREIRYHSCNAHYAPDTPVNS